MSDRDISEYRLAAAGASELNLFVAKAHQRMREAQAAFVANRAPALAAKAELAMLNATTYPLAAAALRAAMREKIAGCQKARDQLVNALANGQGMLTNYEPILSDLAADAEAPGASDELVSLAATVQARADELAAKAGKVDAAIAQADAAMPTE